MTDKQHLRTWELHPRFSLMKEQLRKETWTPYTWSFANSKCGGGMWVPRSKFCLNPYLVLELVLVPASCSIKRKIKKRGIAMATTLSLHQQDTMVSALNVLLLTLNNALPGGPPRITRYVLMLISVWIKLNHASCSLLSVLVCSGLNVWCTTHS